MASKEGWVTKVRELETMAVFALVSLLLGVRFQRQAFIYLAMGFLLIALFVPPLSKVMTLGWKKLSYLLAQVNNRIILTILFYLVLTPLACLYRLFHKDPLLLSKKESGSYYCERNHTYVRADLEKMW
jgi:Saxitoxin biosynthesis operon protein SxtJ